MTDQIFKYELRILKFILISIKFYEFRLFMKHLDTIFPGKEFLICFITHKSI